MKEILDLRLYTIAETADLLATNAAAVRRYIKAGTLRAAKIGAAQMITEGAIKDYLNGVTAQPQSAESYLNAASSPIYKAKKGEKEHSFFLSLSLSHIQQVQKDHYKNEFPKLFS